eukprot:3745447-Prymnesium_polylepis.1
MRRASIAAVARHDAFGCVLTRWLGSSRADDRENPWENRTGHPVRCGTSWTWLQCVPECFLC